MGIVQLMPIDRIRLFKMNHVAMRQSYSTGRERPILVYQDVARQRGIGPDAAHRLCSESVVTKSTPSTSTTTPNEPNDMEQVVSSDLRGNPKFATASGMTPQSDSLTILVTTRATNT